MIHSCNYSEYTSLGPTFHDIEWKIMDNCEYYQVSHIQSFISVVSPGIKVSIKESLQ